MCNGFPIYVCELIIVIFPLKFACADCNLWKNPLLLHSKESITSPLTSLSSEALQNEAVKLFKVMHNYIYLTIDD